MSTIIFHRLAIVGIGLIGASIARSAQHSGCVGSITVIDNNPKHLDQALAMRLGDRFSDDVAMINDADAVILATPSGSFCNIVQKMAPHICEGCIISDTGSVKHQVVQNLTPIIPDHAHLIPAHPVAGTEYSGPEAGQAGLFRNRYCLLTPPDGTDAGKLEQLKRFWQTLGAIVEIMDAKHHDRVLAMTSHLPHFISFALVRTADQLEQNLREEQADDVISATEVMKYSAGGFRDLTRIAHADPAMWRDVFLYNRDAVLEMLHRFQQDLSALAAFTARGDADKLENWVHNSRGIRQIIQQLGQAGHMIYNEQAMDAAAEDPLTESSLQKDARRPPKTKN